MFKVVKFATDAALVSVLFSAIKRRHGVELRTDGIENDMAKSALHSYLKVGDWVVDSIANQMKEYPKYFKTNFNPK
jgi:Fungal protein of unknown function (DUF1748)